MKLKYEFAVREVAGVYAAVAVGDSARVYHNIIGLNESGASIFRLIQEGLDEDQIVSRMLDDYEVTEEVLRPEVQLLVQKLRDEDLLVE